MAAVGNINLCVCVCVCVCVKCDVIHIARGMIHMIHDYSDIRLVNSTPSHTIVAACCVREK
jgi:hypothetical protein